MTLSVWAYLAIIVVLLGVLSLALRFSIKWFWAAIVTVFAALSIASVFQDNSLLWGLDSFPTDTAPPAGMGFTFTVAYISMLGSVGLMWFRAFIVRDFDTASHRVALSFSVIAIVAHILIIGHLNLWNLRDAGDTSATFFSSQTWDIDSQSSSVRALVTLLVGLPLQHWFARKDPKVERNRWFVFTGGLLALGSLTVIGHTAYQPPTWLSHGMDFFHGVGAALWFGGLLGLVMFLSTAIRKRENALEAGRVLTEFSKWALLSVIALAFSGSVMGIMIKSDALAPAESDFAARLTVKLLVAVIPIALAAFNRFRLMPQLRREPDSPATWSSLRKTTIAEVGLLVVILVITGQLVISSPVVS